MLCATPGRLNDLLKRGVMVCVGVCWRGGMVLGMWYIYAYDIKMCTLSKFTNITYFVLSSNVCPIRKICVIIPYFDIFDLVIHGKVHTV